MPDKKIAFNKDTFKPLFTVSRKRNKKRKSTRELVTLSKHASKTELAKYSLSIPERLTSVFTCDRYEIQASKEALAFFPSKDGYLVSRVKKTHRLQFSVEEEQDHLLSHACGSYELYKDQNVLYIVFRERVEENKADRIAAPEDLPVPVEPPTPEPPVKANTSAKKPMIVHQTPSGRDGIVDRDALKLYDALVESTFVSIRDAKRLGLTDSAYKQALNKLVRNYGYCVLSVPIIEANGTKFYVSTLYNDGEWKE